MYGKEMVKMGGKEFTCQGSDGSSRKVMGMTRKKWTSKGSTDMRWE